MTSCFYQSCAAFSLRLPRFLSGRNGRFPLVFAIAGDVFIRLLTPNGSTLIREPAAFLVGIGRGLFLKHWWVETVERVRLKTAERASRQNDPVGAFGPKL